MDINKDKEKGNQDFFIVNIDYDSDFDDYNDSRHSDSHQSFNIQKTEEPASTETKEKKTYFKKELLDWVEAIVFSFVIVVFLFTFLIRVVGVEGSSMEPTLHNKDRVVISHLFYDPKPGDIVVISQLEKMDRPIIKRIIATEGQIVDIDQQTKHLIVDDRILEETYILEEDSTRVSGDIVFPQKVPEGCVFVLGDNRNNSVDSRFSNVGMVDKRKILGRLIFRLFPNTGVVE